MAGTPDQDASRYIDLDNPTDLDIGRLMKALGMDADANQVMRDMIHANALTLIGQVMDRVAAYHETLHADDDFDGGAEATWFDGCAHMLSSLRLITESSLMDEVSRTAYYRRLQEAEAESQRKELDAARQAAEQAVADDPHAAKRRRTSYLGPSNR